MAESAPIKIQLFKHSDDVRSVKAGETIFSQGEIGEEMFIVRSGQVEVRIGDKLITAIGEDEVFGEMALIDDGPRSASALAVTDTELIPVSRKRFEFMVQQSPGFALTMLKIFAQRLRAVAAK